MTEIIRRGAIAIDAPCLRATWFGREVKLTAAEFRVVALLASRPGVVSHAAVGALKIDRRNRDTARNVQSTIKRIRRAFESVDPGFTGIETVYGDGYRWRDAEQERIAA